MTDNRHAEQQFSPELPQNWPNRDLSQFRTVAGIRWHLQLGEPRTPALSGTAVPTLLLLHGTGGSAHQWAELLPALATQAHVIAPDLPGHGYSTLVGGADAEHDPLSLAGMARAVSALVRSLGASPDLIAGHSAGAAVALRMALDGLVSPRSIVGFNPALIPPPKIWGELLSPFAGLLVESSWLARSAAWVAGQGEVVRSLLESSGAHVTSAQVSWYSALFTRPGHCAAALGMMNRWDLPGLARDGVALAVPFTAYAGERDQWVPINELRAQVERLPGARLIPVPGAGHLIPEETPEVAKQALVEALGELRAER